MIIFQKHLLIYELHYELDKKRLTAVLYKA